MIAVRALTLEDVPGCEAVGESIGWGPMTQTWQRMIPLCEGGAFGVFMGRRIVATGFGIAYGTGLAWVGAVLTHAGHQGQGHARRVMEAVLAFLDSCGVRCVMLDATEAGTPLYRRLGFRPLYRVNVFGGLNHPQPDATLPLRPALPLVATDLLRIAQLDSHLMGVERRRLLTRMAERGWSLWQADSLGGYCLAQGDEQMMHLGPWWASTPSGAEALLRTALKALPGATIRLNIPLPNVTAVALAERAGLNALRGCTRMVLGEPPPGDMTAQYGIASFGTG